MRLEEAIGPHIDRTADNHLRQLQRRDDHGNEAWRIEARRLQRIVRVHHRVYAVVHDDEPTRRRGVLGVREPGVDEHSDVVVPVQENERLLSQYNEYCIAEFGQFGEHKQPGPETADAILFDVARNANGMEKAIMTQHMQKFWCRSKGAHNTEHGEHCIPDN